MTNDQANYYSGITSITVNGKNAYELKGKFLDDLHKNAFSGTNGEDAFEHIEYFLKMVDPIDLPNTYDEYKDDWIYEWNDNMLWVHKKPWTDIGVWTEPAPVMHYCKPFNYKSGYSEWAACSWKEDEYCNGENLLGAYIVGNTLRYQDLEWYDALKDSELKEEALRNKAFMEGLINKDDESKDEERCELLDDTTQELPICTVRRFEMIKYSFGQDEEYVVVKEDEYEDLTSTSKDACQAYQEIFRMMDKGWMVTRAE
ncbi:hypothetical protein Tco_1014170 [Tanacetum coccineum]